MLRVRIKTKCIISFPQAPESTDISQTAHREQPEYYSQRHRRQSYIHQPIVKSTRHTATFIIGMTLR